ncbi:MAG: hypothetical protein GXO66_10010 [Euryarchaeota archaeon]|jgi:hypothetical protein|nr:hypothetical protein [Euryarchaeota archaeon]
MVRCEDCALLENLPTDYSTLRRCLMHNRWNLNPWKNRRCPDFQPGP